MEIYSEKVTSGSSARVGNSLGSLQEPRDRIHTGQKFPWLSKGLGVWGHGSTFINICGNNALFSSEGQRNFRLRRPGFLISF
ncbi:hypothetical protein TNCV_50381 [Trichonephila clavipes]|nr:hypothetical protein TNCV_50381 [Trichonephila clavipes]